VRGKGGGEFSDRQPACALRLPEVFAPIPNGYNLCKAMPDIDVALLPKDSAGYTETKNLYFTNSMELATVQSETE